MPNSYTDQLISRLRILYGMGRPIFWELYRAGLSDGGRSFCDLAATRDDGTLSLAQLQKLYRCIISEGYGDVS